jgi:hypothetical protein
MYNGGQSWKTIPNDQNVYQNNIKVVKYINFFHSKAFQNIAGLFLKMYDLATLFSIPSLTLWVSFKKLLIKRKTIAIAFFCKNVTFVKTMSGLAL